jgi:hypothetical protein
MSEEYKLTVTVNQECRDERYVLALRAQEAHRFLNNECRIDD